MVTKHNNSSGFTLIELIVSISIFVVIMTISMGALISIFEANRRARSIRNTLTNLNLAVESMAREARYGTRYHCGTGDVTLPQNCSGGTILSFLSSEGQQFTYRLNGNNIEKYVHFGPSGEYTKVTSDPVVIDSLTFYVSGTDTTDLLTPKIFIKITGHSGTGNRRSDVRLQTMVSQRKADI